MVSEQNRPRTLSEEWRGVRKDALERDDGQCRNCGVGDVIGRLECHHIVPVSEGGEDVLENLATLCSRCHRAIHRLGSGPKYSLEIFQNPSEYDTLVPSKEEEDILDILKFDRANPRYIMNETGLDKGRVEYCLRRLTDAGWVERPARGLYEFSEDPRDG